MLIDSRPSEEQDQKPAKLSLFTTKHFVVLGIIVWFITAMLLIGLLSDTASFLIAIPIAAAAVGIALAMKRSSRGMLFLTVLAVAEIIFIVFAGVFWAGYRNHAWVRKPVVQQAQETHKPYDFSKIKESYDTPENAVLTWAKFIHAGDIPGLWRSESQQMKQASWNNDYTEFEDVYKKSLAERGPPLAVTDLQIQDERRIQDSVIHVFKYSIRFNDPTGKIVNGSWSGDIFLVKEGNQWKMAFSGVPF